MRTIFPDSYRTTHAPFSVLHIASPTLPDSNRKLTIDPSFGGVVPVGPNGIWWHDHSLERERIVLATSARPVVESSTPYRAWRVNPPVGALRGALATA
jgi:hypothetical protein